MNSKICSVCNVEKLVGEFSKRVASKDGLAYVCKTCDNEKRAACLAAHPFYNCWMHMIERCYITTNQNFEDYGGRGIYVCDAWRNKQTGYEMYRDFRFSLGDSMESDWQLDRRDNDGPYSPENCRLAMHSEQMLNRRKLKAKSRNTQSVHIGVVWHKQVKKWQARMTINGKRKYIGIFPTDTEAHQAILAFKKSQLTSNQPSVA